MRIIYIFLITVTYLSITACTVLRPPPSTSTPTCAEALTPTTSDCGNKTRCSKSKPDPISAETVQEQLILTAQSIEQSLAVLAAAEEVDGPPIIKTAALVTPEGGMGGTADIDWTGPVGPLLYQLANITDYRLKTLGTEPAIPIIVSIAGKCLVIADILQNASLQTAKRAHILVFPENRLIELRYLSP